VAQSNSNEPVWDDTRLAAVHEQSDKAQRVRGMFDAIAPTYERINRIFSGGRDRVWRKRTVAATSVQPGDCILDIACGTGDLLRAFHRWAPQAATFVGADFSHEMLQRAAQRSQNGEAWCEADGLKLPFADASFDVTSCAFGVRNFQDLDRGLGEMFRVLRTGGRIAILEFTRPPNRAVRTLHEYYSGRIMPALATLIARDKSGAYRYLPRSVVSFVDARELCGRLENIGFSDVRAQPLTFGVVTIYTGVRGGA
jgi:demethylmenaquinone methyltransferase/2-methoxy-6-polyprenyl-1,4-benzoquinol methylase